MFNYITLMILGLGGIISVIGMILIAYYNARVIVFTIEGCMLLLALYTYISEIWKYYTLFVLVYMAVQTILLVTAFTSQDNRKRNKKGVKNETN